MTISHYTKQEEDIIQVLRSLSQEQPQSQMNASAKRAASLLVQYFETDLASQEFLTVVSDLIEEVGHVLTLSASLLARIYAKRGMAYFSCRQPNTSEPLLTLTGRWFLIPCIPGRISSEESPTPSSARIGGRSRTLTMTLSLDARETFAYAHRGIAYKQAQDYERAIADFDTYLCSNPNLMGRTFSAASPMRSLTKVVEVWGTSII